MRSPWLAGEVGLGDTLGEPSARGNDHVIPIFACLQDTLGRSPARGLVAWGRTGSVPTGGNANAARRHFILLLPLYLHMGVAEVPLCNPSYIGTYKSCIY